MNLSNNTILITGNSAGIGLALAKQFLDLNNTVIICGRDANKLETAKAQNPELNTLACDVSDPLAIANLVEVVKRNFPELNILVNNAGLMHLHDVANNSLSLQRQQQEVMTNFYGVVSLCSLLLPHLQNQATAAILNVSSGLAYMPFLAAPVYTATKAAVHSYSLSIRQALHGTSSVKIFEALPPMVETEMSKGLEMPGMSKMTANKTAEVIIKGMSKDKFEIQPGMSAMMIGMYKLFPSMVSFMMGKMAPQVLADLPQYDLASE